MQPFRQISGIACPLPLANVDTDQLIPARFMKRYRAQGYGDFLLHDLRFDAEGRPRSVIALDAPERKGAQILVARRNFGAGSSREAAVYALVDFGFRCVIAPSFGDIFASNAVNNGVLPARVSEDDAEHMLRELTAGAREIVVDLAEQQLRLGATVFPFAIDPVFRLKLLNGWDDIDLTLSHADAIAAFQEEDARRRPWAAPRRGS